MHKNKNGPLAIFIVVAVLAIVGFFAYQNRQIFTQEEVYSVSEDGILSYQNRPALIYEETIISDNDKFISKKVVFESHGTKIYGLYVLPKQKEALPKNIPAAIVLPGAGVTKEDEAQLPNDLNDLGIATLTIDQRGIGETAGGFPSLQQDYQIFKSGQEPYNHKVIYDALRALDYLQMQKELDKSRIILAGESMGGRNAIIAAAIEPKVAAVLVVGTAGYTFDDASNENVIKFINSINPDNYIAKISPRQVAMMHNSGDSIVPLEAAHATFDKAKEPKSFFISQNSGHGYNTDVMKHELEKQLKSWLLQ